MEEFYIKLFSYLSNKENISNQVAESKRLKALVTMAGPDVICVGAGKESQEVLKVIKYYLCFNFI